MLKLKNIKKDYLTLEEPVHALNGISINFRKSEFVSILGPSGCGKTTLLNIIGGLDRYSSGDLIINGKSTKEFTDREWDSYRNHSVGFVFQSYNLIPHLSVIENVELALTLSGVSKEGRRTKAKEALVKVGLGDKLRAKPNQLSGGQMQRVAIARALVNNPDILLADEPTGALDTKTSVQILDLLKELAEDRLVIMVTHNPELAENYSTRIISLVDGEIVNDTNPYEGVEEKPDNKKLKKTSMSFFTALSLSLKNLLTKKARTLLVAFAGSIGIIGIATILAISSGFKQYISNVEEETLSNYPITIQEQFFNTDTILEAMLNKVESDKVEIEEDKLYSNDIFTKMFQSITEGIHVNDLKSFNDYLIENEEEFGKYISNIKRTYNLTMDIYSSDTSGELLRVFPSDVFTKALSKFPSTEGEANPMESLQSLPVWSEMIDNTDLLHSQYNLLKGKWPTNYDEIVIVVDGNNSIPDYVLYTLGLKDPVYLEKLIEAALKGETYEVPNTPISFDDILKTTYKVVLKPDYYVSDGLGGYKNISSDSAEVKKLVDNGIELKVVGIIQPNPDSAAKSINGSIAYTSALVRELISVNNKKEIVVKQMENPDIDVFSGKQMIKNLDEIIALAEMMGQKETTVQGIEAMRGFGMTDDQILSQLLKAFNLPQVTYTDNLNKLSVCDYSKPSGINLYSVDFASKDEIVRIINEYNEANVTEEDNSKEIQYSDYLGILLSSISDVIDAISYVLFAFVAISLVVSSIMIGIITYISVLERIKEIGILRSVGASKTDISRVFNAETFIIGLTSGVLGIAITLLLIIPINLIIEALADIKDVAALPTSGAIILIIISILLSLIAGLIPSRIASKKDPVEALRSE